MIGAIAGDIIGSAYEFHPTKDVDFTLFTNNSRLTDDTVMTIAVAEWILTGDDLVTLMQKWGRRYKKAGYGHSFRSWLVLEDPKPYNSWGNGSAMRVSPIGWAFDSLEETLEKAKQSAEVTHNHPEGIKGAQSVAAAIYMARHGQSKNKIKDYIQEQFGYNLERSCDYIRLFYDFDVCCQGSVPESILAFMDSTDYESAIRLAVSLGGDADTMGIIAGAIAEAFYKEVPTFIKEESMKRLPEDIASVMIAFETSFPVK